MKRKTGWRPHRVWQVFETRSVVNVCGMLMRCYCWPCFETQLSPSACPDSDICVRLLVLNFAPSVHPIFVSSVDFFTREN